MSQQLQQLQQRIVALEQQAVQLTSQLGTAQQQAVQQNGLPKGVKVNVPSVFRGAPDGDAVKNFISQLENYFALMNLDDHNKRARFTETLLEGEARTWFSTQNYDLATLRWLQLRADLLRQFRPADYQRHARQALVRTRQTAPDVNEYIARFNQAFNRCADVTEQEAQFFFEENLWHEVAIQVLAAQPANLRDSQAVAQRVGTILQRHNGFSHGRGRAGRFTKQNRRVPYQAFIDRSVSGNGGVANKQDSSQSVPGGYAPMVLGNVRGGRVQRNRGRFPRGATTGRTNACYTCGQVGHYSRECPKRRYNNGNISKINQLESDMANLSAQLNTVVTALCGDAQVQATTSQGQGNDSGAGS